MAGHVFTGFGFGPIQGGLFAKEAFQSGNFDRIVVAEIDSQLVDAVRGNKGTYYVNVARRGEGVSPLRPEPVPASNKGGTPSPRDGIDVLKIDGVELLDPGVEADRSALLEALSRSIEVVTCLPSVTFYDAGGADSVASLIAEGLRNRRSDGTIIYAAENNNRAAEILQEAVAEKTGRPPSRNVQFLNTVIGKMSRVVTDPVEIEALGLTRIAPGLERAFLVEEFNRILVSRTHVRGFRPGIEIFVEKDDLLPFEEAKLYGHNAIHALLGFVGALKSYTAMTELRRDRAVMQAGRDAFLQESGAALIGKYAHLGDELFTEVGFAAYAEDLLERMTNPYLGDTIARVVRDVPRKLEIDGRIFGTMRLVLEHGIKPANMAAGALAGLAELLKNADSNNLPEDLHYNDWRKLDEDEIERILRWLWNGKTSKLAAQIVSHVRGAGERLEILTNA